MKRELIWYPFDVAAPVATSASGWKDALLYEAGQSGRSYRHVKPVQLWCYISLLEEGYYLVQKGLRFEGGGGQRLMKHPQTIQYDGEITKLVMKWRLSPCKQK